MTDRISIGFTWHTSIIIYLKWHRFERVRIGLNTQMTVYDVPLHRMTKPLIDICYTNFLNIVSNVNS